MNLDRKIYLVTALAAALIAGAMAIAAPRLDGGIIVHTETVPAARAL
jgi:hypothetical protein